MKEIRLTNGMVTQVDDEWFDYLSQWTWRATKPDHSNSWYVTRQVGNIIRKTIYMHRVITNAPDGFRVDHRDRNGLNNQGYNLRICTDGQNKFNTGVRADSKTGYKGVSQDKKSKTYKAKIQIEHRQICLGTYRTAEEAARVYDAKARELFGDFAYLNFPEKG